MKTWTDEDLGTLRNMRLKGYTLAEIAAHMGRTKSAVKMQSSRRGKLPNDHTDTERLNWLLGGFSSLVDGRSTLDTYMALGTIPQVLLFNPSGSMK